MTTLSPDRAGTRAWHASFVEASAEPSRVPVFERIINLDDAPARAELAVTYLGIGRFFVNGEVVGDEVLEPGWQSYRHRLVYRRHDISSLLRPGRNVVAAEVAPGWWSGRVGFFGQRRVFGDDVAVLAEIELVDRDGNTTTIGTDRDWDWYEGPTLSADLYDGEHTDARLSAPEAATALERRPVRVRVGDEPAIEEPIGPPVRRQEVIAAQTVFTTPSGRTVVDFGRNVVGWVRMRVSAPAGTRIVLRHAEVMEDGELGTRPLRTASATDSVVLAGGGVETWEPAFTYHGFRYVEVTGWPHGEPAEGEIEAVVLFSDMERTGTFRTSRADLAQLHSNVVASMQGNFVSIPTDCPQRDERLGWTGDIAVFAPSAAFLYDCTDFLRSWLRDVALEQESDGRVPNFVPDVPAPPGSERLHPQFDRPRPAVWGDATTLVPAALYRATGDLRTLAENYTMMRRWVDGTAAIAGPERIWGRTGFQFGDWLDPAAPPDDPGASMTDPALVATAYFAHSSRLVARAAAALGFADDEARYARLADEVADAFERAFVTIDGQLTSDSQTAHALALCFDLIADDAVRVRVGERLIELVRENGHRIGTGFVGTPLILEALTRCDAVDDAYSVLFQRQDPSWMYAVDRGATTIWERWDSMLPDGSINPGEMTSFNHYAFGAVAQWLHETVAGLAPALAGYRRIRIAPRPRPPLTDAGATHRTPFGIASVDWRIDDGVLEVTAVVPPGATAVFDLEGTEPFERGSGRHTIRVPARA